MFLKGKFVNFRGKEFCKFKAGEPARKRKNAWEGGCFYFIDFEILNINFNFNFGREGD